MSVDIRKVRDMNGLIAYFAEALNWRIDLDDFDDIEDIAYDFEAEDIGLKEEAFAKIKSLRQLPPLVDGQKWGIFCVEFDSRKFEVTALRKILSGLIPKRRNSADHAVWSQQDLLFICFWGEDNDRTIGVAHFEDMESGLPQIKMISCAPALEDFTQIKTFEDRLKSLKWPMNYVDHEKWQADWSSAFTTGYKQTIRDASTLTIQLAIEAQGIRNRILDILEVESPNGYVHLLYEKFRNTLIHDMTETQFADMYAQTVVYGLFSARCMDETQDDFSAAEAVECIPNTNPFLKHLMKECLGAENTGKLSFDELEIGNVVDLLMHTKTDAIIADFNRQTGGGREDPVIHFYEEFLTAYDKMQKVQRGVYYTPQPVVNFIVRAVDTIIKKDFGLEDGLASTATKTIKVMRQSKRRVGYYYTQVEDTEEVPAIQVLDPATGTGTFIRQTILQIYENFKAKNNSLSPTELKKAWNTYVPAHLLPRINAFELMMAPYAVTHMKLAMVLRDTGYEFGSDARLQVYLTNSVEEPGNSDGQLTLWSDPLATESIAANAVKKNAGINVVIGNPPYNVSSSNSGEYIMQLISEYKDGLNEKKINLDDDYIKFIRLGEMIAGEHSPGILAYISNNSFLDGVTHREMRKHLLRSFSEVYIINLHGNARKKETAPDGGKDENVFDIMQGVSINIFVAKGKPTRGCRVYSYDLYGERSKKYQLLQNATITSIPFEELTPVEPYYFFVPKDFSATEQYDEGVSVTDLFPNYNSGIQTKCDSLSVKMDKPDLEKVLEHFRERSVNELRSLYPEKTDSSGWTFDRAKAEIVNGRYQIVRYCYRPFDNRYSIYTGSSGGFIGRSREKVMKHFLYENIGLLTTRSHSASNFSHVLATTWISDIHAVSDQTYVFPLFSYADTQLVGLQRMPNLCAEKVEELLRNTDYKYDGSEQAAFDVFAYIYGILFSQRYRETNKEFLKIDFPKIPKPRDREYFERIAECGRRLLSLHLESTSRNQRDIINEVVFMGDDRCITKAVFKDERLYINKTSYFKGIKLAEWNYTLGSYLVIQHWFKDRKGRVLTDNDIKDVAVMSGSIRETMIIMEEIEGITE